MTLKEAKTQLRRTVKSTLAAILHESILHQSADITTKLKAHQKFLEARKVAVYMNMPHLEVQTDGIIKSCFDLGKLVYLPRCTSTAAEGRKRHHLSMLRVPTYQQVLALQPEGKYKLLEPREGEDIFESGGLDVIIVPGVAFTLQKHRMGHGAGYYDEFLTAYTEKFNHTPYLIGIGLKEQVVDSLPVEIHDWNLNSLIIGGHEPIY